MFRKPVFVLFVLLLVDLLTACSGAVPVTAESAVVPTEVQPTATPLPTALPTEVPTVIPTEEPTPVPTPTEVPLYVGLPADRVEALREQCLQENPDSACLPLPFAPAADTPIQSVSNPDYSGSAFADGQGGDRYLVLEVPAGTVLLSPLAGDIWVRGKVSGPDYRWLGKPGRSIEGLSLISFGFSPFVAYNGFSEPSIELRLVKDESVPFREGDLAIPAGNRTVAIGEVLAQINTPVFLQIYVLKPVSLTIFIPIPEGGGTWTAPWPVGRTIVSDLLANEAGSIIHVSSEDAVAASCPAEVVSDPSLAPLVRLGEYVIVQAASWEVRESPTTASPVVEVLPPGASYRLTGGPVCADQLVWFQIDSPSGWVPFAILIGDDLFLMPH